MHWSWEAETINVFLHKYITGRGTSYPNPLLGDKE